MRDVGKCAFCDQPCVALCGWLGERYFYKRYANLAIGDRVRRATEKRERPAAIVRAIQEVEEDRLWVTLSIRGKLRAIVVKKTSPVQRAQEAPCGMPVCENHLRRVEPGVEYCADHWRAWEMVA